MLISEVIRKFQVLKKEHGDFPVFLKSIDKDDFKRINEIDEKTIYGGLFWHEKVKAFYVAADTEY